MKLWMLKDKKKEEIKNNNKEQKEMYNHHLLIQENKQECHMKISHILSNLKRVNQVERNLHLGLYNLEENLNKVIHNR